MLDLIALIYFTLSTLSLMGIFPIGVYEFLDFREGFAVSDYGYLFETSLYFSMSAIITGLLCGLDAITYSGYKKVKKLLYNYHAFFSFTLVGIGLFPLTGETGWPSSRVLHWIFALSFLFLFPITRLLILRYYDRRAFLRLFGIFVILNITAVILIPIFGIQYIAYLEYLIWVALLLVVIVSKMIISKKV